MLLLSAMAHRFCILDIFIDFYLIYLFFFHIVPSRTLQIVRVSFSSMHSYLCFKDHIPYMT